MVNQVYEREILLELTFAIKSDNDKKQLLTDTLAFYVKKLNCSAGLVLKIDDDALTFKGVFPISLCETGKLKTIQKKIEEELSNKQNTQSLFYHFEYNNLHHYVFKLSRYGYFIAVRAKKMNALFCSNLVPVFQFYGNAIQNAINIEQKFEIQKQIDQEVKIQNLLIKMASTYVNIDLKDISNNIQKSLAEIGSFVKVDRSYIFDYDKTLTTCSNTYEWCAEGIEPEIQNLQNIPTDEIPDWINMHKKGLAFYVENVSELPDGGEYCLRNILASQGIKSLIALPLVYKSKLMGFVGFDSVKKIRCYTEKEQNLLSLFAQLLVNIQLRKNAQERLIYQEKKYQNLLENVEVGIIETNNKLEIEFINEMHTKLFGYKLSEVKGKNAVHLFIPENEQKEFLKTLKKLEPNQAINTEINSVTKSNTNKNILISLGVKKDIDNNKTGIIGAFLDNTKQKKLENELLNAKKAAEDAAKEKEKFLANISHEMRTPLNVINGNISEVIHYEENPLEQKKLLNQSINASSYLLNLVNNILDLAKIKAGKINLVNNDFNLKEFCNSTYSILNFLAKKNNNEFIFKYDDRLNITIHADQTKLTQVLVNFLNNALKFTRNGKVAFSVNLVEEFEKHVHASFCILDNGIGIENEFLKKIFLEFSVENSSPEGTGLGMPISKKIIDLMGGEVDIESTKNKGTKVEFKLMLKKASLSKQTKKANQNYALIHHKNILVIEDNTMNAMIVKRQLERKKAHVFLVKNGFEAIKKLESPTLSFDLILMDIQMPGMNGITTTKLIRKKLQLKLPIIAVTANVFKSDLNYYLNEGMDAVITKPFTEGRLIDKCIDVLSSKKGIAEKEILPSLNTDFNLTYVHKIADGDTDFFNELLCTFKEILDESIKNIEEAQKTSNLGLLKTTLHKVKPSVADLNLNEIYNKIKNIEEEKNEQHLMSLIPLMHNTFLILKEKMKDL